MGGPPPCQAPWVLLLALGAALAAPTALLAGQHRSGGLLESLEGQFGPSATNPLRLEALVEPSRVAAGAVVTVQVRGTVRPGSYLYSIRPQGGHSPTPTTLHLNIPWLKAEGPLEESVTQAMFDQVFLRTLHIHRDVFSLSRRYRVAGSAPAGDHRLHGEVRYHVCDGKVCSSLLGEGFAVSLTVTGP